MDKIYNWKFTWGNAGFFAFFWALLAISTSVPAAFVVVQVLLWALVGLGFIGAGALLFSKVKTPFSLPVVLSGIALALGVMVAGAPYLAAAYILQTVLICLSVSF